MPLLSCCIVRNYNHNSFEVGFIGEKFWFSGTGKDRIIPTYQGVVHMLYTDPEFLMKKSLIHGCVNKKRLKVFTFSLFLIPELR